MGEKKTQKTLLHNSGPWFIVKRKQAQLTQQQVADEVGVDRSYIAQIEAGTRWPIKPKLFAIFAALGVPADEAVKTLRLAPNEDAETLLVYREFLEEIAPNIDSEKARRFAERFATDQEQYRWLGQWVFSEPLPAAPEGWTRLSKEDRRLVQRLVNRVLDSYPKEVGDADQA